MFARTRIDTVCVPVLSAVRCTPSTYSYLNVYFLRLLCRDEYIERYKYINIVSRKKCSSRRLYRVI